MKWLLKLHYCQFMVSSHFTGVPDDDMAGVQVENAEVQKKKKIWKWITCRFCMYTQIQLSQLFRDNHPLATTKAMYI